MRFFLLLCSVIFHLYGFSQSTDECWADSFGEYVNGCENSNQATDPNDALGEEDYVGVGGNYLSLGAGGSIVLQFTDNLLTNSGNSDNDLWVYEVGPVVEPCSVFLLPTEATSLLLINDMGMVANGQGYFPFGEISGSTSQIDIDSFLSSVLDAESLFFTAVLITDLSNNPCISTSPGADIDAVCALTSVPINLDCAGIPNGTSVFDDCGQCLVPTDPEFNSCYDCAGVLNGSFEQDQCGQCLDPSDVLFNSCLDCAGIPNGTSVFDDCGQCLVPTDPEFNSCYDCAGVLNGSYELDQCGQCLDPTDVLFNNCLDCEGTPNGNAVLDDCGQCLESTDPSFNSCYDCTGVLNGPFELDDCGQCLDPTDVLFNVCLDCAGVPNGLAIIDDCGQCLVPNDPSFNSCYDCTGVLNGPYELDECGQCLEPSDILFNDCLDCAGVSYGSAVIDSCGHCLQVDDVLFNDCLPCNGDLYVYIPNAFSPDNDGINDYFVPIISGCELDVFLLQIYNRWGQIIFESTDRNTLWQGNKQILNDSPSEYYAPNGVYNYQLKLIAHNSAESMLYRGYVVLIR